MSKYYICINKDRNVALYYLKSLHRRRVYRQAYPLESFIFDGVDINKGLTLFKYKDIRRAQKLCDGINSQQNIVFEPVEVENV